MVTWSAGLLEKKCPGLRVELSICFYTVDYLSALKFDMLTF